MSDPTTKPGEALALFVMGKDVSHHVRRVVLDFIPRIERAALAEAAPPSVLDMELPEVEALSDGERRVGPVLKWWQEQFIRLGARAERAEAAPPSDDYAALAANGTVNEQRYHTDPVYHAIVYRLRAAPPSRARCGFDCGRCQDQIAGRVTEVRSSPTAEPAETTDG